MEATGLSKSQKSTPWVELWYSVFPVGRGLRFVSHLYQSGREYRSACERVDKSGKRIERVIAIFQIAQSMGSTASFASGSICVLNQCAILDLDVQTRDLLSDFGVDVVFIDVMHAAIAALLRPADVVVFVQIVSTIVPEASTVKAAAKCVEIFDIIEDQATSSTSSIRASCIPGNLRSLSKIVRFRLWR
jgi:hypothetical protein